MKKEESLIFKGELQAQYQLGSDYLFGNIDGKVDYEKAVYLFTKSAEQGYAEAKKALEKMGEK